MVRAKVTLKHVIGLLLLLTSALPSGAYATGPPVALDDAYSLDVDTVLNIPSPGVLANDSDPDGDPLTAVLVTLPSSGSLTLNADGSFVYTPNLFFSGIDGFTYKANDGILDSNLATVTLTVQPPPPPPLAVDDSFATQEDTILIVGPPGVLGNDFDAQGDILTAILGTPPTFGSLTLNADGSFVYTPNANFCGSDSFAYVASDGLVTSNIATVNISVTCVHDPPIALDDSYSVIWDTVLNVPAPGVLSNDSDIDSSSLFAVLATSTSSGSLTLNIDGSFTYTPALNFFGTDSFTYKSNDGFLDSNIATVTISVVQVCDVPVALDDFYSTDEDTVLTIAALGVLSNDVDLCPPFRTPSAVLVSAPSHGTLTLFADGGLIYTPNLNFFGTDSFRYLASFDGRQSNIATVVIEVKPLVITISIDVKPGSDPNSINVKSAGVIPVAILTTPSFDATSVNASTVRFGRTGTEAAPLIMPPSSEDVDGDGDLDVVFQFEVRETSIQAGDTTATLTGRTLDGVLFEGTDAIRAFFPGDVNGDLVVDILDLALVGSAFGSTTDSSRWNPYADFNEDNTISILDLVVVGQNFGQHA